MTTAPLTRDMRIGTSPAIDRYLPVFDVRNAHSVEVMADPTMTYRAMKELDLGRSLPVAALFAIRGIPHYVTGKARPSRSFTLQRALELGFTVFEERSPREIVMGTVGKFWRPDSGIRRVTAEEFLSFDEPGHAKAAMSFTVEEHGRGSVLATETRVACTDASALRKFSLYWRLIGPFSGLIRHIMLAQVKRDAERT